MEQRPKKSDGTDKEGVHVPAEVVAMMEKATWPSVKMADLLYNSLLKRPNVILKTDNVSQLVGQDMIYRDGEQVALKIRQSFKKEEAEEEDDDEEEEVNGDYSSSSSSQFHLSPRGHVAEKAKSNEDDR